MRNQKWTPSPRWRRNFVFCNTTLRNWVDRFLFPLLSSTRNSRLVKLFHLSILLTSLSHRLLPQLFDQLKTFRRYFRERKVHFRFFACNCVQVFPHTFLTAQFLGSILDFFRRLTYLFRWFWALKNWFTYQST